MKKFMKYFSMMFAFVTVMLLGSFTTVNAGYEPPKISNKIMIGPGQSNPNGYFKRTIAQKSSSSESYYVYGGLGDTINFKLKRGVDISWIGSTINYDPELYVVKCDTSETGDSIKCKNPLSYKEDITVGNLYNAMASKTGYELTINPELFGTEYDTVAGVDLTDLRSDYGLDDKTYFVIITLTTDAHFGGKGGHISEYQIFKVVDYTKIGGTPDIDIEKIDGSDRVKVTITSSSPIHEGVQYFAVNEGKIGIDTKDKFLQTALDANVPVNMVKKTEDADKPLLNQDGKISRKGYIYVYSFEMKLESGKYYYMMAEDEAGSIRIKDLSNPGDSGASDNEKPPVTPVAPNAANTNVGKIVLYVLIGVLVLAAVLLIIQRIIDQKRKVY